VFPSASVAAGSVAMNNSSIPTHAIPGVTGVIFVVFCAVVTISIAALIIWVFIEIFQHREHWFS